ncbi:MAG TPA: hypothetical protein VGO30_21220 [Mycobacterium sp.]|nr:hypothetical protein [Mycobacterium sp.]
MFEIESPVRPVGRIWPWVVAAIGVLIVVVGAVLFSPDAAAAGSSPTWFG